MPADKICQNGLKPENLLSNLIIDEFKYRMYILDPEKLDFYNLAWESGPIKVFGCLCRTWGLKQPLYYNHWKFYLLRAINSIIINT